MTTVIIPAHDEAATIREVLHRVLDDFTDEPCNVLVVANGCTDGTADAAREVSADIEVVEMEAVGKSGALRRGDELARSFPRIYLDADVEVEPGALRGLATALRKDGIHAAGLTVRVDTTGCSWLVGRYFRYWERRRVLHDAYVGSGVYGLSEQGHAAIAPFPEIVADDHYVRTSFPRDNRRQLCKTVTVFPPRNYKSLIRRGVRIQKGNRQVSSTVADRAPRPTEWGLAHPLDALAFFATSLLIRFLVRLSGTKGDIAWSRDESSRRGRTA
ncbi:glycosyltransferase [Blastococcus goldschmidtiae]|uniref:glycosyltransferase n=1 Tax=Blastococcus goldschmidtiae TaxID=3075546 RepID=UPI0037BF453E